MSTMDPTLEPQCLDAVMMLSLDLATEQSKASLAYTYINIYIYIYIYISTNPELNRGFQLTLCTYGFDGLNCLVPANTTSNSATIILLTGVLF